MSTLEQMKEKARETVEVAFKQYEVARPQWHRRMIDDLVKATYNARTQEVCEIINDITAPEGAWRDALEGYKKVIIHTIKALTPEVNNETDVCPYCDIHDNCSLHTPEVKDDSK
jgi:hypothetical protein